MNHRLKSVFWPALLAALWLVGGCVTVQPSPGPEVNEIEQAIQQATSDARAALQMLAQVRAAEARTGLDIEQREDLIRAATYTPLGMERPLKLTAGYTGPIEELLRMLAGETGYRIERHGQPPLEAVIVTLPAGNLPVITSLRDAAWQASAQGVTVNVYDESRTVRLVYAN